MKIRTAGNNYDDNKSTMIEEILFFVHSIGITDEGGEGGGGRPGN